MRLNVFELLTVPIPGGDTPMRLTAAAGFALSALVSLVALSSTRDARAEEQFDVTVAGGKVTVTAKGAWHINKDYPWKLTSGDAKLDKSKFTIAEKTASVAAPKGAAHLKGAVCQAENCMPFEKDVTIP
jgi:hypothetical protein